MVISCLGLHWTNDLPGAMIQVFASLLCLLFKEKVLASGFNRRYKPGFAMHAAANTIFVDFEINQKYMTKNIKWVWVRSASSKLPKSQKRPSMKWSIFL